MVADSSLAQLVLGKKAIEYNYIIKYVPMFIRGSQNLQNLVAIFQRYYQPMLISKADCIGNDGKNWLLNPGTSSRSEGYSSKWQIRLVCGVPLSIIKGKL